MNNVPTDYYLYYYKCSCGDLLHKAEQPYCQNPDCSENPDNQEACQNCGVTGEDLLKGLCCECTPEN